MSKYKVTFLIKGEKTTAETVKITATDPIAAQNGAFKSQILPKYKNGGYQFLVIKCIKLN